MSICVWSVLSKPFPISLRIVQHSRLPDIWISGCYWNGSKKSYCVSWVHFSEQKCWIPKDTNTKEGMPLLDRNSIDPKKIYWWQIYCCFSSAQVSLELQESLLALTNLSWVLLGIDLLNTLIIQGRLVPFILWLVSLLARVLLWCF